MVRRVANPLALANTLCAERGINPSQTFTFPLNPPLSKGDLVVGRGATNEKAPAASGGGWALSEADNSPPSSQSPSPCKHPLRRKGDKSLPDFHIPPKSPFDKGGLGRWSRGDQRYPPRRAEGDHRAKRGNPTSTQIREWLFVGFVWFIGYLGYLGYLEYLEP